ncbi:ragulator complex protein LAMTOR1-like [Clavelina lepadiformis]|uniref:Ragulator complex protein LAMTOR1 n=1 Tax=Clavelina lepadiformis TaxID=159417 RepID=A0ABP0H0X4_CLALP
MWCCRRCFGNDNDYSPLDQQTNQIDSINSTDPVNTPDYHDSSPVGSAPHSKHDEQSILSGIITQYNHDVIDMTALDSKIDAVEYMNRVQLYNRKVATLTSGTRYKQPSLRSAGNNPALILKAKSVDFEDVCMITELAGNVRSAMNAVKVEKHKDLVLSLQHR